MTDIQSTLKERQKTHGDYKDHAYATQRIKVVFYHLHSKRVQRGQPALSPTQLETLDMIAHKIGRIFSGDADFHDHWHDIAGYATLVANEMLEKSAAPVSTEPVDKPLHEMTDEEFRMVIANG